MRTRKRATWSQHVSIRIDNIATGMIEALNGKKRQRRGHHIYSTRRRQDRSGVIHVSVGHCWIMTGIVGSGRVKWLHAANGQMMGGKRGVKVVY